MARPSPVAWCFFPSLFSLCVYLGQMAEHALLFDDDEGDDDDDDDGNE